MDLTEIRAIYGKVVRIWTCSYMDLICEAHSSEDIQGYVKL